MKVKKTYIAPPKWFLFEDGEINEENLPEQWRGGFRNLKYEKRIELLQEASYQNEDQDKALIELWISLLKCVWVFCNFDHIDKLNYTASLMAINSPLKSKVKDLRAEIEAAQPNWKRFADYREFWNGWMAAQKTLDKTTLQQ